MGQLYSFYFASALRIFSKRFLLAKGSKSSSVNTLQWKEGDHLHDCSSLLNPPQFQREQREPTPAGRKALLLIKCNCDAYFEGHHQRKGYRGISCLPNRPRLQQKFASKICWCYTIDVICPASLQWKQEDKGSRRDKHDVQEPGLNSNANYPN